MAARYLTPDDVFMYQGRVYRVRRVSVVRGRIKVKTDSGTLTLKPDVQVVMV